MQIPITKQQIEGLIQKENTVRLIDIRRPEEYQTKHVPGAVNIPSDTIAEKITNFAANDTIVCICNKGLERSQHAAETITSMGFTNVFYLEDGTFGWLDDNDNK
jgi:rhodanese-related sulfurtransferase